MNEVIGNGAPVFYDHKNAVTSLNSPSTVHVQNTRLSYFFRRYLLQKAMSVFKWELPETWAENYFMYVLYCWGRIAVVKTDRFGVIPQACGLRGYDVFYQPTNAIITNPLLRGILEPRIGTQCTLFKLQPDYGGILDLVSYYGDMMALCAEAAGVNLLNSKISYAFFASSKNAAESMKKAADRAVSGEPFVVMDKQLLNDDGKLSWQPFFQNVRETYIVDAVLSDMRKLEAMFDTDIGIPNANTDKRERLITSEVNANAVETYSKCSVWLEQLQESCEKCNAMFPEIKVSVDWRVQPSYEGDDLDEGSNDVDSGDVPVRRDAV